MGDEVEFVQKARQAITDNLKQFELLKRFRSQALYHYVSALDARAVSASLSASVNAEYAEHRVAVETSAKVLETIYACCTEEDDTPVRFSLHAYREAEALIDYVAKLDTVEYCFDLVRKGQFTVDVDVPGSRLTFRYADAKADKADTGLRARELEMILSGERGRPDSSQLARAVERIGSLLSPSILLTGYESCTYQYSDPLFEALREYPAIRIQTVPEEMDSSVVVAEFSFGDLRKFWAALLALSDAHIIAHWTAATILRVAFPGRTMVLHRTRRELEELLSRISQLPSSTVQQLISLHLYDPGLPYRGPVLQPLIGLNSSEVCLPYPLLAGNNFERNFFKLLRRHPALMRVADSVESQKEPIAIQSLTDLFPGDRYRRRNGIQIPALTDIDFVVYELATGFVLLIQHKWLVPPETVDESSANDERLAVGVRQAVNSRKYVIDHPDFLRQHLGLIESDPISRIEAAVVCRGFEHTGFFDDQGVSVLAEITLKMLFRESPDLPTLWNKICGRPDRDVATSKVVDLNRVIRLAGFEFVAPSLGRIES